MINETLKYYPFGNLGLITMKSFSDFGAKVHDHIIDMRRNNINFDHGDEPIPDSYKVPINEIRFSNGEGKVRIMDSVRGKDIYVLCDVGNYSCGYEMFGMKTAMGPDEHFQDLKRTLSAIAGKSRRVTVIMPRMYASRQHRRKNRESLDCAMALQELASMGVSVIITFDVHDPNIQNAVPLLSFENLYPTYDIIRTMLQREKDLKIGKDTLMVISPDTGAMDRAIYYSDVLGLDVGLFYKRRDINKIVNGKNPIVAHEYMGNSVEGKDALIVDDMIASGDSVLKIARELKKHNARHVYIAVTFGQFTDGIEHFNKAYEDGIVTRVYSTNLTYLPPIVKAAPWFCEVDSSMYVARLIDALNYDRSVAPLLNLTEDIRKLL